MVVEVKSPSGNLAATTSRLLSVHHHYFILLRVAVKYTSVAVLAAALVYLSTYTTPDSEASWTS